MLQKLAGWATLAAGILGLIQQFWVATHLGTMDPTHVTTSSGLIVGGVSHLANRSVVVNGK